ncbi:MAG: hypothetical protein BMS9Abin33_0149 [Gammaproteobacteria bacterium]|nr:MAG: hypothetical protein BMS9Abin33_0149 [Gammaproteobacteria bacterium]
MAYHQQKKETGNELQQVQTELREREREIALLKEIADAVSSQLKLDKVFEMVAERARSLIDSETLLIPLLDQDCEQYTYRAGCGKNADEIIGESLPLDFGVCGWVWKHKRPWWRGVLEELSESERNRWEKEAGTMIMVPLIGKHHFLGGIAGINKAGGGDFSRRDLDLLSMFASQVSIAIENATAYERLEQAKERSDQYQKELVELNTKLVDANKKLENLALYDHLTGIPNRSLIQDRMEQSILRAQRDHSKVSVLMVDLDHFKEINDTLGHDIGDKLLQKVCNRLRKLLRGPDTLGRLGGDEFAVIAPDASSDTATLIANNLLKGLEQPIALEGQYFSIAASIGIATYPEHGENISTLLKRADVAMYVAKRAKSGYFVYDSSEDQYSPGRLALMHDLRESIGNNELLLHYQPKIDMSTATITGVEALARWPHPEQGMFPPEFFIPIMEQTGLIRPFTAWVLKEAISQCAKWKKSGLDMSVSINLSMHNLRDPDFPGLVCDLLKKWEVAPESLILEITESVAMGNNRQVPEVLTLLSQTGIQFSIDDFGTGFSSLMHLKKLKVNELKIDKSFIAGMQNNKDDEIIVRSTIDLGHNLGLRIVAEGVETEDTFDKLKNMGCEQFQGHLVSKALASEDLTAFAKTSVHKFRNPG